MGKWFDRLPSVMFLVCDLQSEPFNGQGSLPSGGAGGYNAFTQAAVSGVGHAHSQNREMYYMMVAAFILDKLHILKIRSSKHSSLL